LDAPSSHDELPLGGTSNNVELSAETCLTCEHSAALLIALWSVGVPLRIERAYQERLYIKSIVSAVEVPQD
jgi:hypothetical protein